MKRIVSKILPTSIVIVMSIAILSAKTKQAVKDYTGKWVINISQSRFDSLKPDVAPKQIIAKQNMDSIVLTKTFEHPGVDPNTYSQSFYFSGKASERIAGEVERRTTMIKIADDTLLFDIHGYVNNRGFKWEYTATESWVISSDQNELIVNRKAVLPDRIEVYKAVYDKQ